MDSIGFVGVFGAVVDEERLGAVVDFWLERYERVEQVCPGNGVGALTMTISKRGDLLGDEHPQFRVLQGEEFAWVYFTRGGRVVETTGFAGGELALCLDVLVGLPGLVEIVEGYNEKRLDELEAEGLM